MAATEERVTQATEYIVLERIEIKNPDAEGPPIIAWVERDTVSTTVRMNAAKEAAGEHEGEKIWRPIPTRNWGVPIRTRPKVETTMVAEEVPPF